MSNIKKTSVAITSTFREQGVDMSSYLYLKAGTYVDTGVRYNAGDECKAITVIRYATGGSGRDLMGYSTAGAGYWGVTAGGAWEPHGTFSTTQPDITKITTVSYTFSSTTENGVYNVGRLATSYSVRDKYIYSVELYKNGTLVRHLLPRVVNGVNGLYDVLNDTFHNAVGSGTSVGNDELFDKKASIKNEEIVGHQLIEI